MITDKVKTGFCLVNRDAWESFGIQADLVTYVKVRSFSVCITRYTDVLPGAGYLGIHPNLLFPSSLPPTTDLISEADIGYCCLSSFSDRPGRCWLRWKATTWSALWRKLSSI